MVGIGSESEAKSPASPTKGRGWGPEPGRGALRRETTSARPRPCRHPRAQRERLNATVAAGYQRLSRLPVGGHPPEKGQQRRPPQTLLRHSFQGWTHLGGPQVPSER